MTYDEKNIPEFALQPAKEREDIGDQAIEMGVAFDDGFDPTPYDRLLSRSCDYGKMGPDSARKEFVAAEEFTPETFMPASAFVPVQESISEDIPGNTVRMVGAEFDDSIETASESDEAIETVAETDEAIETVAEMDETIETVAEMDEAIETVAEADEAIETVAEADEAIETVAETDDAVETVAEPSDESIQKITPTDVVAVSPPKKDVAKIIPLSGSVISSDLKLTDIREKPQTRIFIEEDILVPDIKPDMAAILAMDGTVKLSNREIQVSQNGDDFIKVSGEIALQTVYLPEMTALSEPICTISSRMPFKTDWGIRVSPLSNLTIQPVIESVDFTVINERKFRAKIALILTMREYAALDVQLFEGIRGEEVQLLKEKITLTDVAVRKSDTIEINEELSVKDGAPLPERILKQDINIVENHKQITGEKAVINATVYCNVMYLAKGELPAEVMENIDGDIQDGYEDAPQPRNYLYPCFYQGKTEFTQFIPMDDSDSSFGSRVGFDGSGLAISIKEYEDGGQNCFELSGVVGTSVEIYKNMQSEIVTDVYHNSKDIDYEYSEIGTTALAGSGVIEVSVREILNVPAKYGDIEKVAYISGKIKSSNNTIEQGKNVVEGVVEVSLICIAADEAKTPFKMTQDLAFRGSMEIPGIQSTMVATNDIAIKDLWFDKINNKQVEVNASVFISSAVSSQDTHKLIKNVCFVERAASEETVPCMVIYITKNGDNYWKIAKKYKTTIDSIKKINNLEQSPQLSPGTKLLIVR